MMNNLKELVEKFIDYTTTWSITEDEWYENINCTRQNAYDEKNITDEEFERAIREELLYEFIYNINGIKRQMENDICEYSGGEFDGNGLFEKESKQMEKDIQKIFKDFKLKR